MDDGCDVCPSQVVLDLCQKQEVYQLYKDFMIGKVHSDGIIGKGAFLQMWRTEFPHVRQRKPNSHFLKCRVCEDLEVSA